MRSLHRFLICLLLSNVAACSQLQPRPELPWDAAIPLSENGPLDRAIAPTEARHPGQSAFRLVNELFLASGPLGHMTKSDIGIARAEIGKALDTGKDGQTHTWSNPETKASGTIKPTKTFTKDGMRCRSTAFTTSAGGERGASTWNLCSTKDGWKVAQ